MKRYILMGAPGAGKTAILRHLELDGYGIVEEAATGIITLEQAQGVTEPWSRASFIDAIIKLHVKARIGSFGQCQEALKLVCRENILLANTA